MQARPSQLKPKYNIKDFAAPEVPATNKISFLANKESCKVYCLCNISNSQNP
jgi:hypothetical protein